MKTARVVMPTARCSRRSERPGHTWTAAPATRATRASLLGAALTTPSVTGLCSPPPGVFLTALASPRALRENGVLRA